MKNITNIAPIILVAILISCLFLYYFSHKSRAHEGHSGSEVTSTTTFHVGKVKVKTNS